MNDLLLHINDLYVSANRVSYFSGKKEVESPVSASSSVVSSLASPPMRTTPSAEDQETWWSLLCSKEWVLVQEPPLKVTQEVCVEVVSPPPQVTSPDWVWWYRFSGRSGRLHQRLPSS